MQTRRILMRSLILLLAFFMALPIGSDFANAQNSEGSVAKSKAAAPY